MEFLDRIVERRISEAIERGEFSDLPGQGRPLCFDDDALIPPELSDMTRLVRVQVYRPLLAWSGLGNSVVTDAGDGLGSVRLPAQNHNPARRLKQLYIPGLWKPGAAQAALTYGSDFTFTKDEGLRGFLYL